MPEPGRSAALPFGMRSRKVGKAAADAASRTSRAGQRLRGGMAGKRGNEDGGGRRAGIEVWRGAGGGRN